MTPQGYRMTLDGLAGLRSSDVVTRDLLENGVREHPDRRLALFEDGTTWTWREALIESCAAANVLRERGLRQGDAVALLLPNGADFLRAWWGAALLGASILPINPALRGALLERPVLIGRPVLVVATPELVGLATGNRVFDGIPLVESTALRGADTSLPSLERAIGPSDIEKLLLTSGTTGPSKLVQVPYLHPYWGYATILLAQGFTPDDVFQIDLPLFHSAALGYVNATLVAGSSIYVRARPASEDYWDVVRDAGVTGSVLISSMVPAMLARPPRPSEREHRMRFMLTSPIPIDVEAFKQRFGVPTMLTSFGSTETSAPVLGEAWAGADPAYCGEVRPGYEVRLIDADDQDVAVGSVGEAVVRCARPFVMTPGYANDADATAHAYRSGWFHTGDLLRFDEAGRAYFVDRAKDVLRRNGENISAYEVEIVLADHPGVAEVACVPVPSDTGVDDEVKAWLVPRSGSETELPELLEYAAQRLPYYMVPRYFEMTDEIPKTPTGKPQKYLLRERGNTASTFDCVAHGYRVTRHGVRRSDQRGA